MADEVLLRAAMAAINTGRVALGAGHWQGPMPAGIRYDTVACPIARCFADIDPTATMGRVALQLARADTRELAAAWRTGAAGHGIVYVPTVLYLFRRAFDAGEYPALELP